MKYSNYSLIRSENPKYMGFLIAKNAHSSMRDYLKQHTCNATFKYNAVFLQGEWKNYFKFTFVRNPWDRLVSCWKNKIVESAYAGEQNTKMEFSEFVYEITNGKWKNHNDIHWCLQTSRFPTDCVDFIGRFENLKNDFDYVCSQLNIPHNKLFHYNKTKIDTNTHYTNYYSNEVRKLADEKYEKDISFLNYTFGE